MKKIGKEVCFLKTQIGNIRNGEGSFIRLNDNRIMFAYTRYLSNDWSDHSIARIEAIYSSNEGETWSETSTLIEKDTDALNIMSVSLIQLNNGDLGVLYLKKTMIDNEIVCMPYFARSTDDGKTFNEPICCIDTPGYYVVNNDRLVRLKNGRIIFPAAYHGTDGSHLGAGSLVTCFSDDDGKSFKISKSLVRSPYNDSTQLQEPGIYELKDGRIWMFCRTAYGHQYQCFSEDNGETFGVITPAFRFTSPDSPMQVKNVHNKTVAIFNPIGYNCLNNAFEEWNSPKRTPYVIAVCDDGCLSFVEDKTTFRNGGYLPFANNCFYLEDDLSSSYCYPAVIETKDGFLVAYYHSNKSIVCLNCTKITKVKIDEIDD